MDLPSRRVSQQDCQLNWEHVGLRLDAAETAITDLQDLSSAALAVWTPIWFPAPGRSINATGTTLAIAAQGDWTASGGAVGAPAAVFHWKSSDYAIAGKTFQMRVVGHVGTNATAPACTFTYSMRPVTFAGGAGVLTATAGSIVTGGSVAIASPAASSSVEAYGTAFTPPSDGAYTLAFQASVAQAANSYALHNVRLEGQWT